MILSRTIARARIAQGEVPSWFGAWGLVVIDGLLTALVVWGAWGPVTAWAEARDLALPLIIGLMFAVFFIPIQGIMIFSALWAVKSRWRDEPGPAD